MKLLFVLTYYTPHWTGLTQYAKLLAEGLVTRGHSLHVLTNRHEKSLSAHEIVEGVVVERAEPLFQLSRTTVSLDLWLKLPALLTNVDSVVVFLPSNDVFIVTVLAKLLRKKVIFIYNGDLKLPKGITNRGIEAIYHGMTTVSMYMADNITVLNMDYVPYSRLLSQHRQKLIQIYPPLTKLDSTKKTFEQLRTKIGKASTPVVGFAGRFVEEKGFDILLKAIPIVAKKFPNVRFVYAGSPVWYEHFFETCQSLIEKAGEHLVFLGKLQREDMGSFYKQLDVLAVSSRSDFFPFVQVEAMLSGVPIVVTDIPGARVPVQKTGFGKIVEKENPQALADGICELIQHKKKYISRHKNVENEFRYEQSLIAHEEVLL